MCFYFLYNICLKHFFFQEEFSEISSKMSKHLHVKYPLLLSDFNYICTFSTEFRKSIKYQVSSISVHWEPTSSMRTNGQTDMIKLIVAFRNFAKPPKKGFAQYPNIPFKRYQQHSLKIKRLKNVLIYTQVNSMYRIVRILTPRSNNPSWAGNRSSALQKSFLQKK